MRLNSQHRMKIFRALSIALSIAASALAAPERWTAEIAALTKNDATKPVPRDAVVFVGSSSIRLWSSLKEDFPGVETVNRGFGGSELADSVFYADRVVLPYAPRTVVLYAGENDINAGKTPDAVLQDFRNFSAKVHTALPKTRIIFISMKPSPSRVKVREAMIRANALIAAECAKDPRRTFLDIFPLMLDAEGKERRELYKDDMLHMKPEGYVIWTKALAPLLK